MKLPRVIVACPTCESTQTPPLADGYDENACHHLWHFGNTIEFVDACPGCLSVDREQRGGDCCSAWHRGVIVHLQHDPSRTLCGTIVDDPSSRLAMELGVVSCEACRNEWFARSADGSVPGMGTAFRQMQQLLDQAHSTVISTEQALTAQRELIRSQRIVSSYQERVVKRPDAIIKRQDASIAEATALVRAAREKHDEVAADRDRLAELVDFMRDHYSPIGGRPCALCVYEDGVFIRACALHKWVDIERGVPSST